MGNMIKDCRINKSRCKDNERCNPVSGRCIASDGARLKQLIKQKIIRYDQPKGEYVLIKNNNNQRNLDKIVDKIVDELTSKIDIIPKLQPNMQEERKLLNKKVIYSIIFSWIRNKDEFLEDPDDIREYIDDIFLKEL